MSNNKDLKGQQIGAGHVVVSTYADQCLERAKEATPGPWHIGHVNEIYPLQMDIDGPECGIAEDVAAWNVDFIIHARTDVPELARRLSKAINAIKTVSNFHYCAEMLNLVAELEAPLEEGK